MTDRCSGQHHGAENNTKLLYMHISLEIKSEEAQRLEIYTFLEMQIH